MNNYIVWQDPAYKIDVMALSSAEAAEKWAQCRDLPDPVEVYVRRDEEDRAYPFLVRSDGPGALAVSNVNGVGRVAFQRIDRARENVVTVERDVAHWLTMDVANKSIMGPFMSEEAAVAYVKEQVLMDLDSKFMVYLGVAKVYSSTSR